MISITAFLAIFVVTCYSESEDCNSKKRLSRCASIFEDLSNCYNETYKSMLMGCLVTCNACDSYKCSNPQSESVLNCTALASQCDSEVFSDFMREKCPATCGKCNRKNANLCSDNSSPEVCTTMAEFCNTVDYYDLLTSECPSTCNRCPQDSSNSTGTGSHGCIDTASDCSKNQERCSNPQYAPLMHRLCPKTCKSCNSCEDNNKMCPQWTSQGFCKRYSQQVVLKSCAKTCGLCK